GADLDRAVVAAQRRGRPDRGPRPDVDLADQHRRSVHERARVDLRDDASERLEHGFKIRRSKGQKLRTSRATRPPPTTSRMTTMSQEVPPPSPLLVGSGGLAVRGSGGIVRIGWRLTGGRRSPAGS